MRLTLAEQFMSDLSSASSQAALFSALENAARHMGFDHFALAYDQWSSDEARSGLLVHDYPESWARVYVGFEMAGSDPVRRACEKTFVGFEWRYLQQLIRMTGGDHRMLGIGREYGIGDGFTVPRHLPGEASGSCTFVVRPDSSLPSQMLHIAELAGALALASARRIAGAGLSGPTPGLTERQRECLLWWARGKTAAEVAIIMGISIDTVNQHLKMARERYDVHAGQCLLVRAIFDGLLGFGDVLRWLQG